MTKIIFYKILIIILPIIFILGSVWIYSLHQNAQNELVRIKVNYVNAKKKKIKENIDNLFKNMQTVRNLKYKETKNSLKENVRLASRIMKNLYDKYHGKIPESKLKEMIIASLRNLRFLNGRGYFFISTMQGQSLMHGNIRSLEKKSIAKWKIQGAQEVYNAILKTLAKSDEGFVEYSWIRAKNINDKQQKKISFVKYFAPFDWYIGAGDYIEDMERELKGSLLELISQTTFNKNGFAFVIDSDGTIIYHKDRKLIGKVLLDAKDKNGKYYTKEAIKIAKSNDGGGFLEYLAPYKPTDIENYKKISFLRYIKELDWILGTGVFVDTLDEDVKIKQEVLKKETFNILIFLIVILLFSSFLVLLIARQFKLKIDKSFQRFESFFKRASTNSVYLDVHAMEYYEFEKLAVHTNELVNKIKDLNQNLEEKVKNRTKKLKIKNAELKKILIKLDNTEANLIQNQKMATLGQLVAGITHEINTPIGLSVTGITYFSELSKKIEKLYKTDNLSQHEFEDFIRVANELADTITINLQRAAETIKSFKAIAIDQTNIEKRVFNFRKYIDEILLSLRNKTKQKDIEFIIDCDTSLEINSFPGAMSQILTNFIMNSMTHGFEGKNKGKIFINVKEENETLHVEYSDDGVGISKENMTKLFKPFFTTKKDKGGSGLGLSIVKKIVSEQLNGTIKCTSQENKGVKFEIVFPIL